MNKEQFDHLEGLVDRVGLAEVVSALAAICRDKSDHLACNPQDEKATANWLWAAVALESQVQTCCVR